LRALLKHGLSSSLFSPAMKLAQAMRFMLPPSIKAKVPSPRLVQNGWPSGQHQKKVLMLAGCVQPAMQPQINISTARVLDAVGIQTIVAKEAGCCGAVKFHLNDQAGALDQMRNNIDAWWPYVETGVEAIVINASGCSISVKEYGYFLKNDMAYADKARRISDLCRDLTEMLPPIISKLKDKISPVSIERAGLLALHPPCTLQHGLKLRGELESHLRNLGFKVELTVAEQHLCCGSAGTYSVLQPELSNQLRDRKIRHLQDLKPSKIVSANIGCISHLQSGTTTPVRHWIEILDQALAPEV